MSNERLVHLGEIKPAEAFSSLNSEVSKETSVSNLVEGIPRLTSTSFSTFRADHGVVGADLVVHFYLPHGVSDLLKKADSRYQERWETYWFRVFPEVLSQVARAHFREDKPRIVAKYTEELASWWFCARGFGDSTNPDALLLMFFQKMDKALGVLDN